MSTLNTIISQWVFSNRPGPRMTFVVSYQTIIMVLSTKYLMSWSINLVGDYGMKEREKPLNKSVDGIWTVRCVKYQMMSIGDTSSTDLLSMNLQQKLKMVKNHHSQTMLWWDAASYPQDSARRCWRRIRFFEHVFNVWSVSGMKPRSKTICAPWNCWRTRSEKLRRWCTMVLETTDGRWEVCIVFEIGMEHLIHCPLASKALQKALVDFYKSVSWKSNGFNWGGVRKISLLAMSTHVQFHLHLQ